MAVKRYRLYVTQQRNRLFTTTDIEKHQVDKLYRIMYAKFPEIDGYFVGMKVIAQRREDELDVTKFYEGEKNV